MMIKVGNNYEGGFARNEAMGEVDIILGDIMYNHGKGKRFDCVV